MSFLSFKRKAEGFLPRYTYFVCIDRCLESAGLLPELRDLVLNYSRNYLEENPGREFPSRDFEYKTLEQVEQQIQKSQAFVMNYHLCSREKTVDEYNEKQFLPVGTQCLVLLVDPCDVGQFEQWLVPVHPDHPKEYQRMEAIVHTMRIYE